HSIRIDHTDTIRFVPANDRKSTLKLAHALNISHTGIAMSLGNLLPETNHIEIYVKISDAELIPALAERVWINFDDTPNRSDWIKAGFKLYFRNEQHQTAFTKMYSRLGGSIKPVAASESRVSYVF
ncbi:MAG: hypothetical protein KDD48_03880, partial [Bdellovibrionales bacterium]|nr:hypothetical protein [Bdellovibrionales bacterium]